MTPIHWIAIYPFDSITRPLNCWALNAFCGLYPIRKFLI